MRLLNMGEEDTFRPFSDWHRSKSIRRDLFNPSYQIRGSLGETMREDKREDTLT